ncbi:MAG TPA: hypothetical protein VEU74_09245 [Gemmatimonadales bacterium]|nr:hypothetical protein [Gemmatimonadales bacterium]
MAQPHNSLREGIALGVVVATTIWVWLAVVDGLAGQPFRTFQVLGGVAFFTVLHYVLCVVYGVVALTVVHEAARAPSLLIFAAFCFFLLEFAFVMATVLLANVGLGQLAWVRILGGNVIGAVVTFLLLARRHPLLKELDEADREE